MMAVRFESNESKGKLVMSRQYSLIIAGSLAMAAACGGSTDSAETAVENAASSGAEAVENDQAGRYVAHFSTDTVPPEGFILDLGQDPPKFKRDGSDEVFTLEKGTGPNDAVQLTSDEGDVWIRVERYTWRGGILYDGPNQNSAIRAYKDADADPL